MDGRGGRARTANRAVAGKVRVKLPWPLPKIDIG